MHIIGLIVFKNFPALEHKQKSIPSGLQKLCGPIWRYQLWELKEILEQERPPFCRNSKNHYLVQFKIRLEHELVSEFISFYGNKYINPLKHFYWNPVANVFIFQNYILGVYKRKLERLAEVEHPCKVILMDRGLDSCQIFATL